MIKGGLQLNSGEIGVELRMKERRIEEGIHQNQFARSPLSERLEQATCMWWRTAVWSLSINHIPLNPIFSYFSLTFNICPSNFY